MRLNFEHRSASHCETGNISNMLNYNGYQLNEPMIFGIGSGLYFFHLPFMWLDSGLPICNFRTLPGNVFVRAMKNLHIKFGLKTFVNKEKAMLEMDKLLAEGKPVGAVVGVYFLPYFSSHVLLHFNAHNICIIGKEGDDYIVSEPVSDKLQKLTYKELQRARFAKGVLNSRGKMYWIIEKQTDTSYLKKAVTAGIKRTCRNMLDILFPFVGVKGIAILSKRMRRWEEKYGEKNALRYLRQMIAALEELGTGGAGFRFLYSAFLQEASDQLNLPKLKEFSLEMNRIGDLWRQFTIDGGRLLKNNENVTFEQLADKLSEIAGKEKEFFLSLRKYIKTECKK